MAIEIEDRIEETNAVASFAAQIEEARQRGATPLDLAMEILATDMFPRFIARLRAEATTAYLVRGLVASPRDIEKLTLALVADQVKRIHAEARAARKVPS